LLFILSTYGSARPEKIGQEQTCQVKEEIDLDEATVGEEAAMAAVVVVDMGEVEEAEEAMVVEEDTVEDMIGAAVGIGAMNEIVAQFQSKRAKRLMLRLNRLGAEEMA